MILNILQIVFAALLVASILIQQKSAGLGAAFGGGGSLNHTRRGPEKTLHVSTIILAVIFFGLLLADVFVN